MEVSKVVAHQGDNTRAGEDSQDFSNKDDGALGMG